VVIITRTPVLGLFLAGLLLGALTTFAYVIVSTPKPVLSACASLITSNRGSYVMAERVDYAPPTLDFLVNSIDQTPIINFTLYSSLFSSVYFDNSSYSTFDFKFSKNSHFNNVMYGGDYNSSIWTYPTQMRIGTQNGLLIIYVQILYLYGSPYGNHTAGGSNQLTLFTQMGNWSYGFGSDSNLLQAPPTLGQPDTDGLYTYSGGGGPTPNQTYYLGPITWDHPLGTGPENVAPPWNYQAFYYSGAHILGTYDRPMMTRYLYAINMSRLPESAGSGCMKLGIMWNLSTFHPFGIRSNQTQTGVDFLSLNDAYPTHSIDAPLLYSDYLTLYVDRDAKIG
jgi:hypothetical protein